MQIQPVTAIRPMRIRQKPVTAVAEDLDTGSSAAGVLPVESEIHAQPTSRLAYTAAYHGNRSAYSAQLLANHVGEGPSDLERQAMLATYAADKTARHPSAAMSLSV